MTSLYQRLKRGMEVGKHEVDAAIRLTRQRDADNQDDGSEPNLFGGNVGDGTRSRRRSA